MSSLCYFSSGIYPRHFSIKKTQELIAHVFPPSTSSILEMHPEENVPAQDQLDDWKDVKGIIKACSFLISSKLALKNSKTCCQKRALDLQSLPIPVHQLRFRRDCLCLPIEKTSHNLILVSNQGKWYIPSRHK